MFKRILLAFDGTLEGAIALREGALLARRCGSEVHLLSVVPRTASVQVAESVWAGVVAQQTDQYRDVLERGRTRLRELGFDPKCRLVVGEPAVEIGAFAREVKADLVVVGHRRQNILARWWSGDTKAYLSDHVECSILIARNPISDAALEAELQQAGSARSA